LPATPQFWACVAAIAVMAGTLIGWTIENVPIESLGVGGWTRSLALAALAFAAPLAGVAALASDVACPTFARVLGRGPQRPRDRLALACGVLLIAVTLMAIQAALELVFDPRYRDFPFAPLSAATFPFLMLGVAGAQRAGFRQNAEQVAAVILVLSAIYIAFNETLANWQADWFAAVLITLAIILGRVRDAPG
jgi:glucan 1,3-beta-glucosidase